MDLTRSIEPNSSQVNADDLIASDRTVTITGVESGSAEQPVFVHLQEIPDRTWRPSKSMRRVLVAAWGPEASNYVGRRVTLTRNPDITFGRERVGGIEVAAMSHLDKPLTVALTATRGKRKNFTVQPLPDAAPQRAWLTELANAGTDIVAIGQLGQQATQAGAPADVVQQIRERFQQVKGEQA
ncbi:hypothetical protein [Curtobacterium sp. SORGH_AS_0776]|uniref:hypothetical protein n=1 Tax=Curtobacterium sp. SORGH_AS_0776 TaxID=3041798 RepID=UPI00285AC033|nr:hypothetical protein [Curtobacterium sp. SORGH_AS_0776]MDR6172620.1 hypothetical protein [Curtobacterium sp. SORGH_AS_0776]